MNPDYQGKFGVFPCAHRTVVLAGAGWRSAEVLFSLVPSVLIRVHPWFQLNVSG